MIIGSDQLFHCSGQSDREGLEPIHEDSSECNKQAQHCFGLCSVTLSLVLATVVAQFEYLRAYKT